IDDEEDRPLGRRVRRLPAAPRRGEEHERHEYRAKRGRPRHPLAPTPNPIARNTRETRSDPGHVGARVRDVPTHPSAPGPRRASGRICIVAGTRTVKHEPTPARLVTSTVPPRNATSRLTMCRGLCTSPYHPLWALAPRSGTRGA